MTVTLFFMYSNLIDWNSEKDFLIKNMELIYEDVHFKELYHTNRNLRKINTI
jgi:hypothetical protein